MCIPVRGDWGPCPEIDKFPQCADDALEEIEALRVAVHPGGPSFHFIPEFAWRGCENITLVCDSTQNNVILSVHCVYCGGVA